LIPLKVLASFPMDRFHISVGARSRTSTAEHGVLTMASLRFHLTPS